MHIRVSLTCTDAKQQRIRQQHENNHKDGSSSNNNGGIVAEDGGGGSCSQPQPTEVAGVPVVESSNTTQLRDTEQLELTVDS